MDHDAPGDGAGSTSNQNGRKQRDPLRTYRAPDAIYLPAKEAAEARGEPVSEVIRRALAAYVGQDPPAPRRRPRKT